MTDIENKITYYKAKLGHLIAKNQSIDPLHIYREKYNIPVIQNKEPLFTNTYTTQQQIPFQYEFTHNDIDGYLRGETLSVEKALVDQHSFFEKYYFPILATQEAYKQQGARRSAFAGGWEKGYENDEVVEYVNKENGKNYIAIRGTRPTDMGNLLSDLHILGTGNIGTLTEASILRGTKSAIQHNILSINPTTKYNIVGHSLGSTKANIIQHYNPEQITDAYLFNMGMSQLPTGWKPYQSENSIHYHIQGDVISSGYIGDKMKTLNVSPTGRARLNILTRAGEKGQPVTPLGNILHQPEYHSLDTFLHKNIANKVNQYQKIEHHTEHQQKINKTKMNIKRDIINLMPLADLERYINDFSKIENIEQHSEEELRRIGFQLYLTNKSPLGYITDNELLLNLKNKKNLKQLKTKREFQRWSEEAIPLAVGV